MPFTEVNIPYQSPIDRELSTQSKPSLYLTPFNVQRIVNELVTIHWKNNDPSKDGYTFNQRYAPADSDSGVFIGMSFDWKANPIQKRPSIIIQREDGNYSSPVIGQTIGNNVIDSEKTKMHMINMICYVCCIASPVGFAEQFAEWTSKPLLQYEEQIRNDFRFRRFRMAGIGKPQLYKEAKDQFIIVIKIETSFDSNVIITEDNLKLKTISRTIFLGLNSNKPLTEQ